MGVFLSRSCLSRHIGTVVLMSVSERVVMRVALLVGRDVRSVRKVANGGAIRGRLANERIRETLQRVEEEDEIGGADRAIVV